LIYRRLALRSIPTTPASSPCKNGRLLLRRWHVICNGLDKFFHRLLEIDRYVFFWEPIPVLIYLPFMDR